MVVSVNSPHFRTLEIGHNKEHRSYCHFVELISEVLDVLDSMVILDQTELAVDTEEERTSMNSACLSIHCCMMVYENDILDQSVFEVFEARETDWLRSNFLFPSEEVPSPQDFDLSCIRRLRLNRSYFDVHLDQNLISNDDVNEMA